MLRFIQAFVISWQGQVFCQNLVDCPRDFQVKLAVLVSEYSQIDLHEGFHTLQILLQRNLNNQYFC